MRRHTIPGLVVVMLGAAGCEAGYPAVFTQNVDLPTLSLELTTSDRIQRATFIVEGTGNDVEIMAPGAAIWFDLPGNTSRVEAIDIRATSTAFEEEVTVSKSKPSEEIGFGDMLHTVPFSVEILIEAQLVGDVDGEVMISADVEVFFDSRAQRDSVDLTGSLVHAP